MSFSVLVLAAQRTGVVNALAQEFGVSHKCIVPICGAPLIAHVLDVLCALPDAGRIRISVESDFHAELDRVIAPWRAHGKTIELVPSQPGLADSVVQGLDGLPGPYLITTADNVLVSPGAIASIIDALEQADAAIALADQAAVTAAHPEGQRRYYRFRDAAVANCNLYGLSGPGALVAAQVFREGGQFMNNPGRLVNAFGLINILMMRWGLVTLDGGMRRISRRLGITVAGVRMTDGAQAIDVDNRRTYDIAGPILAARKGLTFSPGG